ncbi:MAG: M20/M25/M40 family metallo-hydrolase [Anaerolineae bacterium]|nr:M20/M25/M40 family metallo-hydrolase [Anaerolineae bacterium]
MMKRTTTTFTLLPIWFLLVLLACTLTSEPPAPTLVPRATSTPPPTIGYATLAPDEFPREATQVAPVIPQPGASVLSLMNQVDADRLFETIDALVGMRTRRVNSFPGSQTEGIDAAANYVLNQFNRIRETSYQNSFSVATHEFPINWDSTQSTGRNIIGILSGTQVGGGVIVLAAHYDSISYNFDDSSAFAPGANDNASGMAALLEIARIMSQRRHRATVMFIAFSAEEIQRTGSKAFVEDYLTANNIQVSAMINMDDVGSSTSPEGAVNDNEIRIFSAEPNESNSRQLARTLNLIAARLAPDMKVVVQETVDRPGRYGDHMSFSDQDYPAVRFTEALEDFSRQHSDRDTIDGIRASYLVNATKTILACMTALADGPPPPQNIGLRSAASNQRTLAWERVPGAVRYIVALRRPDSLAYNQYFEISEISTTWDGFVASRFASLAIAAIDDSGLIGPLSPEFAITS